MQFKGIWAFNMYKTFRGRLYPCCGEVIFADLDINYILKRELVDLED